MSTFYTTVNDQFTGTSLNTDIWSVTSASGFYPGGVSVSSGSLVLTSSSTLGDTAAITLNTENSADSTPLTPATPTTQMIAETKITPNGQRTSGGGDYTAYFGVSTDNSSGIYRDFDFQLYTSSGTGSSTVYTLVAGALVDNTYLTNTITTSAVSTALYLRISVDTTGTPTYQYSTNGTTWTTATAPSGYTPFINNTGVYAYVQYSNYNVLASQATATYDYITFQTTDPPAVSFTATPVSGVNPLTVTFTDTSPGTFTAWSWDFGDGNTSTSQNPSHTYTTGGVYTVSLTATDYVGSNTKTLSNLINVGPGMTGISSVTGLSSITF